MAWRVAKALLTLRDQVNARWPNRNKDSDGTIGNAEHSARSSDHNPTDAGIVCAMDITHDPKSGCDSYALAEVLRASRDPRIKYIISNRKICSSQVDAWNWRPYHGSNPHDHHVHISVLDIPSKYDSTAEWNLNAKPMPAPASVAVIIPPTLRKGDDGDDVKALQRLLNTKGLTIKVDGDFGKATETAIKKFQAARGLVPDGVAGPQTWYALGK